MEGGTESVRRQADTHEGVRTPFPGPSLQEPE